MIGTMIIHFGGFPFRDLSLELPLLKTGTIETRASIYKYYNSIITLAYPFPFINPSC